MNDVGNVDMGCYNSDFLLEYLCFTVNPLPTVEAGSYGPICVRGGATPITLTGLPTDANGSWAGDGVTDAGNGTATFDPAVGTTTVTYTYTTIEGCSDSVSTEITVNTTACDNSQFPWNGQNDDE